MTWRPRFRGGRPPASLAAQSGGCRRGCDQVEPRSPNPRSSVPTRIPVQPRGGRGLVLSPRPRRTLTRSHSPRRTLRGERGPKPSRERGGEPWREVGGSGPPRYELREIGDAFLERGVGSRCLVSNLALLLPGGPGTSPSLSFLLQSESAEARTSRGLFGGLNKEMC